MHVLTYIIVLCVAIAQCSQEKDVLEPLLVDLIKRLANHEIEASKEVKDLFLDYTRKQIKKYEPELRKPIARSNKQANFKNNKYKNKFVVKRRPRVGETQPEPAFYRPTLNIYNVKLLKDKSNSDTILNLFTNSNHKYENKNRPHVFKILRSLRDGDNVEKKENSVEFYVAGKKVDPKDIFGDNKGQQNKQEQKITYIIRELNNGTQSVKKKRNEIQYPFWNYWTYKKSIIQDSCPGLQVKVNGMCVRLPPH